MRIALERAEGFVDTGVQERFDECEVVMSDVLRNIRSVGSQWKVCLIFPIDKDDHALPLCHISLMLNPPFLILLETVGTPSE